ncbi:hypothetical protein LTR56_024083 [Elasticomyces elasticus]|nr:hypothetical protein LTR56_024083 [Elasticomyces elasticus]KAK3662801.1 hypothetical protein LTR22_006417 [Elasticomyces elasticus]KAK4897876.1 hypothetical protein LTR49_027920 [Elasticomyces elasticus]KAK5746301.1 hypothetical protein LTS12_022781 [Elasticomyces elasticus]
MPSGSGWSHGYKPVINPKNSKPVTYGPMNGFFRPRNIAQIAQSDNSPQADAAPADELRDKENERPLRRKRPATPESALSQTPSTRATPSGDKEHQALSSRKRCVDDEPIDQTPPKRQRTTIDLTDDDDPTQVLQRQDLHLVQTKHLPVSATPSSTYAPVTHADAIELDPGSESLHREAASRIPVPSSRQAPERRPLADITNRPPKRVKLTATSEAIKSACPSVAPSSSSHSGSASPPPSRPDNKRNRPQPLFYAQPARQTGGYRHRSPSPSRIPVKKEARDGDKVPSPQPYGFRTSSPEGLQARMLGEPDGPLLPPIAPPHIHDHDDDYEDDEEEEEEDDSDEDFGVEDLACLSLPQDTQPSHGGAIAKLRQYNRRRDGILHGVRLHPSSFTATDLGRSAHHTGFRGTTIQRVDALAAFEKDFRFTIKTAKTQAKRYSITTVQNSRFCPQTWRLLTTKSEDEIFSLVESGTIEDRRALLGSGILSDAIVAALPRATEDELKSSIVYLDWIKCGPKRYGYTSSGQAAQGGGMRMITYERAKQYAHMGLVQKSSYKNPHLDVALHEDAKMSLRVIVALPQTTCKDMIVLCEGLFTDFLRTLDVVERTTWSTYSGSNTVATHSREIMDWCLEACPQSRRIVTFTGLNQTTPIRQGSGMCGGSLWGWYSEASMSTEDIELIKAAHRLAYAARIESIVAAQGGCCTVCSRPFAELDLRRHGMPMSCNFRHLDEHRSRRVCDYCYQSYSRTHHDWKLANNAFDNGTCWPEADERAWLAMCKVRAATYIYRTPTKLTGVGTGIHHGERVACRTFPGRYCVGCGNTYTTLQRIPEANVRDGIEWTMNAWKSAESLFKFLPDLPSPPKTDWYCASCYAEIVRSERLHPYRLSSGVTQQAMLDSLRPVLQPTCTTCCSTTPLGVHPVRDDRLGWGNCLTIFSELHEEYCTRICQTCIYRGPSFKRAIRKRETGKLQWTRKEQQEWIQWLRQHPPDPNGTKPGGRKKSR